MSMRGRRGPYLILYGGHACRLCPGLRRRAKNGIASGTGNGFAPTTAVTREQLAVFLYNYAKAQGMDLNAGAQLGDHVDANDISPWAVTAMDWATGHGLISGKAGDRLDPAGIASRAEVATLLMRFLEK